MRHMRPGKQGKTIRRKVALANLQNQLHYGEKTPKGNAFTGSFGAFKEPLTEGDIKRIKSEIAILETKI